MSGKIFINYRRGDDPGFVGRLFDRLRDSFPDDELFMDVDSITPGFDFVQVLEDQVDKCDVFLAVIGPRWLDAKNEEGERRLNDANDFVRIEIESGLKLGKRIIPVLVNDAAMPRVEHLPEPLQLLVRRHAVRLTHERFNADAQGLVKVLEDALAEAKQAREAAIEAERRAREGAARKKREEEEARAAEAERQAAERSRQQALAGLEPEAIQKAEELASWDFIKGRGDERELHDHIARYSGGITERFAWAELEELARKSLGEMPDLAALEAFLDEFPAGRYSEELAVLRAHLQSEAKADEARRKATEAERPKKIEKSTTPQATSSPSPEHQVSPKPSSQYNKLSAQEAKVVQPQTKVGTTRDAHASWYIAVAFVYAFAALPTAIGISGGEYRTTMAGLVFGGLVMAGLAVLLARRRAHLLTRRELRLYWLGGVLSIAPFLFVPFAEMKWNSFDDSARFGALSDRANSLSEIEPLNDSASVRGGWLGVNIQDVDKDTAASLGLSEGKGALISMVEAGGPAANAGLKVQDAILGMNGYEIEDSGDLVRKIAGFAPETTVNFRVWRNDIEKTIKVKLGTVPSSALVSPKDSEPMTAPLSLDDEAIGAPATADPAAKSAPANVEPLTHALCGLFGMLPPDRQEGGDTRGLVQEGPLRDLCKNYNPTAGK